MTLSNALICLYSKDLFDPVLTWRNTDSSIGPWGVSAPKYGRGMRDIDVISRRDLNQFKNDLALNSIDGQSPSRETIERWIINILFQAIEDAALTAKGL